MSFLNLEGAYENELAATGEFNPQAPKTALMLPSGQRIVLPTALFLNALEGTAAQANSQPASQVAGDAATLSGTSARPAATPLSQTSRDAVADPATTPQEAVIPLVAEQLQVSKTEVETARVRFRRETEERVETVSVPLEDVRWEVEHVPVDRVVETQPEIRQVGETIIFPLVEERLVVKRELWLREEVHVHKVRSVVEKSADFTTKHDVLREERTTVGDREP